MRKAALHILSGTLFRALLPMIVIVGVCGCSRSDTEVTAPAPAVSAHGIVTAVPVQLDNGSDKWYLLGMDGRPVGETPLNGRPTPVYYDTFVAAEGANGDQYNVYRVDKPLQRLNSQPFSELTDFRTGYAYGTRTGRPIMVVNRNGAVVRVLPDRYLELYISQESNDGVVYLAADGAGVLRPNGDEIANFDGNVAVMPLSGDRFITFSSNPCRTTIYDDKGKTVYTFAEGIEPVTECYHDGWLGVYDRSKGESYFVDRDGNRVLNVPAAYRAYQRYGNVVLLKNPDSCLFAMVDATTGHFLLDNLEGIAPLAPGSGLFACSESGSGEVKVVDSAGKDHGTHRYGNDLLASQAQGIGFVLDEVSESFSRPVDLATGKVLSDVKIGNIRPVGNKEYLLSAMVLSTGLDDIVGGISSRGLTVDNYLYSDNVTAAALLDGQYTPEGVYTRYNDNGKRSVPMQLGQRTYNFVFDAMPALKETVEVEQRGAWGLFSFKRQEDTYKWNPQAKVRAIFFHVENGSDPMPVLVDALRKRLENTGFVGYYDNPFSLGSGNTFVYIVPTTGGCYVVVSFGQVNYDTLTQAAYTAVKPN